MCHPTRRGTPRAEGIRPKQVSGGLAYVLKLRHRTQYKKATSPPFFPPVPTFFPINIYNSEPWQRCLQRPIWRITATWRFRRGPTMMCITYKSAGRDKNACRRILKVSCARHYITSCADSRLEHPIIIEDDESLSEGTAGIPQKKRRTSKSGRAEAACQRHLIPVDDLNHVND